MSHPVETATPERFTVLCLRSGVAEDRAHGVFQDLVRRYAEAHRHYHNLHHIRRMLDALDATAAGTDAVELAIWFHDAIYDPAATDNEAQSAAYFATQLGAFTSPALAADVERLILATTPAMPRTGRKDEDLIIDLDLGILGAAPAEYEAYRAAIRREYSFVPEPAFLAGRSRILQHFLAGEIYATDFFRPLEGQARANLRDELALGVSRD